MNMSRLLGLTAAVSFLLLIVLSLASNLLPLRRQSPPLELDQVERHDSPDSSALLVRGSGLHPDLKAVITREAWSVDQRSSQIFEQQTVSALAKTAGTLLLAIDSTRLVVCGREAGYPWRIQGSIDLPSPIADIVIWNNQALASLARNQGIAVIDLDEPKKPHLLDIIPVSGLVQDLQVVDNALYFTDLYQGVGVYDLGRPGSAAVLLDRNVDSPWRMAVHEQKVAVGTSKGQVHLYERLVSGHLQPVATLELPSQVRDLTFYETSLLAVTYQGTLYQWAMDDWPSLPSPRRYELPGTPIRLAVDGERHELVVSLLSAGLLRLRFLHGGGVEKVEQMFWPTNFQILSIEDGLLYAAGSGGLEVFEMDNIAALSPEDSVFLGPGEQRLVDWQGHVYGYRQHELHALMPGRQRWLAKESGDDDWLVQAGDQVVDFFRFEAAETLRPFATLTLPYNVIDAVLDGETLYTLDDWGLHIYSAVDMRQPRLLGEFSLSGMPQRLILGYQETVLVSTHEQGVLLIDVRQPAQPVLLASYKPVRHHRKYAVANDMLRVGSVVYIAQGLAGVDVVDLRELRAPRLLCSIDTPGYANSLTRSGDLLMVGDGMAGGFMLDIVNPAAPQPVGQLALPTRPGQLLASGDHLLVANRYGVYAMQLPATLPTLRMTGPDTARIVLPVRPDGEGLKLTLYAADGRVASAAVQ